MITVENNNFFTIDEFSKKLNLSRQTILNRISTGKIPAAKIENKYYISEVFLDYYIKERNLKLLNNIKMITKKYENNK